MLYFQAFCHFLFFIAKKWMKKTVIKK